MEIIVNDLRIMYRERNEALRQVTRAHHDALLRLARAAELRDDDTGVHIFRIGYLAEAIALLLGEGAEFSRMLRSAAPMHDIGKIGIPDDVLKKRGPLTAAERVIMNRHPEIGADILGRSSIPLFVLAAEVALCHHERWNGLGYPRGLKGEEIPISARIVAVADFFDALAMDRCYRSAFAPEVALGMLQAESGQAFDPRVVEIFTRHFEELLALRQRINAAPPTHDELLGSH
ncbi:HD domain-containing protein [Roseateles sp. SL47]|uniref:HD-GYP domain-containing protein n=1 Tax=Roseateles sp. SL47 TaxID=2995138 RepID=UPI00226FBED7|nr:HD domain-containing phosphohydrolase [Roseateles sp. SL47]WAC75898.1 HD domain-containing protein [Roseateles sp. SL47]